MSVMSVPGVARQRRGKGPRGKREVRLIRRRTQKARTVVELPRKRDGEDRGRDDG